MARGSQKFASFSSSLHPSCASFALGAFAGCDERAVIAHGSHHELLYCAQDCGESKFRSSPMKSDSERKKRHDCFFFFFILCNDNDIIDMNNAMSATTPFFITEWFSRRYRSVMYCPPVHSIARTLQSDMFLAFSSYFKGISPLYSSQHGLNTDSVAVPFCPLFSTSDNINAWFLFFLALSVSFSDWQWPSTLIAIVKGDCKEGHEASSASSSLFGCLHPSCWGKTRG